MDGFVSAADVVPCDACAAVLADFVALVPTRAVLALAIVILLVVLGADAERASRGSLR